ncbi:hypothetical protein AB0368_26550 [Actinoplanes sp. NPDC051475]|uniref:hypothetical protein n=1 Tax=Actinoplanes sp. NPDC051475 TaxID=3157225 RepID=UPI00344DEBB5
MTAAKRGRWVTAAVAAVLAAGVLVWWIKYRGPALEDELSPAVRASLTIRARDALEAGASANLTPDEGRLACAVRVLGTDPPAVVQAAQARTVFVWAMCSTVGTEVNTESSLPVAIHLSDPPAAEVPGDGSLNGPDRRRIFPERLQDVVAGDGNGYGLEPQMRQRVQERR